MKPEMGEWLRANDLAEFEAVFVDNQVDFKTLEVLTEIDLKELGLPFGPRKRVVAAIEKWKRSASMSRTEAEKRSASIVHGERRQITVMFCDLVGSTALSGLMDPEELSQLMQIYRKACSDLVARYEGFVAQYLGDGLMIYFGWPVAHEDDAERGVRSALEMVQAVKAIRAARPLAVRIGLATGPVVVGETVRDGNTASGLAVGETPNMAARLQALAGPNEVVIAPTTRRLVGDVFALTDQGAHSLKGISQPVQVWRVEEVRRSEGRFSAARGHDHLTTLVGRDEEDSVLVRCWEQAGFGKGQVVLLSGQAGIGKSRLTQSLRQRIGAQPAVLHYQCSPYHLNSPLHPFIEQLEQSAGFARDDAPERRLEKLETRVGIAAGGETLALFATLLSLPTDRYPPLHLSPRKQKEKTLEALVHRVETLARHAPVLIVVEDIHWIDPTSQELLELLVPKVLELPALMVLTHRPEYSPPWGAGPGLTMLALNRLGREQGARLVETVTQGRSLPPDVLDEILTKADGVPLFVEELTRSVLESGLLREERGQFLLQSPQAVLAIPVSLRDSLMARLDRLGAVKELAQIGACIGREFSCHLLERVALMTADVLRISLKTLMESGLVTQRDQPPDAVYVFKHALVQDAAYDSLLKSRRGELHARIAAVLEQDFAERVAKEPEWLAHHHTQAGHLNAAIPLWRKAGTMAVARVALKEAVAHFQKGLLLIEQLPPAPERDGLELTIREPLNAAWTGLRGWAAPEVSVNGAEILRLAESQHNPRSRLLAMWWIWTSTITQGRIAKSAVWVDRLRTQGDETGDIDFRIFGHATAMVQHFLSGQLTESREQTDRALALYDANRAESWIKLTGHDLRTFVEVYACQLLWIMGYPEKAKQLSNLSRTHAHADGHPFNLVWALTYSAYVYAYRREPELFLERVNEADRLARDQGLSFIHEVAVPQAMGVAELEQGRPHEAIALLRLGIERWTKTGGNVRVPFVKSALAEAIAQAGDPASALQLIDECVSQIEGAESQERLWLAEVLRRKGWILLLQGHEAAAEGQLLAAIECARQQQAKSWELRATMTLATLWENSGRRTAARELLAPIYHWFNEGLDTKDLIAARQLLERLSA